MTPTLQSPPRGARLPAEWEAHERCWMAWPCNAACFNGRLDEAREAQARVARAIAAYEPVTMLVRPEDHAGARDLCGGSVELMRTGLDDSWTRDTGPVFLSIEGGLGATAFRFNGWGGVWSAFEADARVAATIADFADAPLYESSMVFEGGAIATDGAGTLLTTISCARHRNPTMELDEIEVELRRATGCTRIIWLPGDDGEPETHGHVDLFAAFVRPGVVAVSTLDDPTDPLHRVLEANRVALEGTRDANGQPIELIHFPNLPTGPWGPRACRSYVNFYVANGAVVLPIYGEPTDERAVSVASEAFPDRDIVPVRVEAIAQGGGAVHCITAQQPAVHRPPSVRTAQIHSMSG